MAGCPCPKCHGGLTLSLDLSNAFDTVNRRDIEAGMQQTQLPADLRTILLCWLNQVQYHLGHKGLTKNIDVTRGIRQGCVASPFLWLMWTIHLLSRPTDKLGPAWVRDHLSIYADDIISQWHLFSIQNFQTALQEIGLLLDMLEAMHLTVSLKKSVALLRIVGTARKELYKKYTSCHEGQTYLIIPRAGGKFSYLPIVKQHKYMGTVLTYSNPEDSTLTYRLQCGKQAFFRLIKFLGKSHALPLRLKLRLWTQCVLCSYMYGLFAVGLTQTGYTRLSRSILQDLRRITQRWSHLTHVTNLDLPRSQNATANRWTSGPMAWACHTTAPWTSEPRIRWYRTLLWSSWAVDRLAHSNCRMALQWPMFVHTQPTHLGMSIVHRNVCTALHNEKTWCPETRRSRTPSKVWLTQRFTEWAPTVSILQSKNKLSTYAEETYWASTLPCIRPWGQCPSHSRPAGRCPGTRERTEMERTSWW